MCHRAKFHVTLNWVLFCIIRFHIKRQVSAVANWPRDKIVL